MQVQNSGNYLLTVAEYFAGIGLIRLGLESAGWRVLFANDYAQEKSTMYCDAFPDGIHHYHVADVHDLDPSAVPTTTLATCSFPCIDLSLAGNQAGLHGEHSSAFWGFINILNAQARESRAPTFVLLENVVGWLTSNRGADFRITIEALNALGYACDVFTLDAQHFTPQSRPRVFVVGSSLHRPEADRSPLMNRPGSLASNRLKKSVAANDDLKWMWLNIDDRLPQRQHGLMAVVETLPEDDLRWWSQTEVDRHLDMMTHDHKRRVQFLAEQKTIVYRTAYRRIRDRQRLEVRDDDIAGCLRTARGGSSRQILLRIGEGHISMRFMTPREYARLQGVPDTYPIQVNEREALNGFGDAVCVPLVTWIARNVLTKLFDPNHESPNLAHQLPLFRHDG